MSAVPHDWSVVVAGSWNRAILTPQGIVKRLFGLRPDTPVELQVAMNEPGLIRVKHDGIVVSPLVGRLVVAPFAEPTATALKVAAEVASRALLGLPETPVTACGVNIRFTYDGLPDRLIEFAASTIDDRLSDSELSITSRLLRRTVKWHEGVVNIELLESQDASGQLNFNFNRDSVDSAEQVHWLERVSEMHETAERLRRALED